MKISINVRRILLLISLLWVVGLLFVPMRRDVIVGYNTGDSPDTQKFVAAHEEHVTSLLDGDGFDGSAGAVSGLLFFALLPFFVIWESFSFKRPFTLPGKTFLQVQSLFIFLGGPYCYYMITYQPGNNYEAVHQPGLAWGGVVLVLYEILFGVFMFIAVANQKGKFAQFFNERK